MRKIEIRSYEEHDWISIEDIHDKARYIELKLANLEEAFVPLEKAAYNEGLFDYVVDVAVIDDKTVGFIAYTKDEIGWLYVHPEYMGNGIGAKLVQHVIKNNSEGSINIEVLVGNEPARKLYEKLGFKVVQIAEGVMPGNESFSVHAYCMEK